MPDSSGATVSPRKFFCMASPQKENGYTSIANELMEAFARTPSLGSEAFQVLMLLLRRSYGFNRKDAVMSISFIAEGTGLKRNAVSRAIERLATKRLLVREGSAIKLNKNYQEWVSTKRLPLQPNGCPPSNQTVAKVATKRLPNKETFKETPKKEILATPPAVADEMKKSITKVFETFQMKINPDISYGNKTQRTAAEHLIKAYGVEKVIRTIEYAASIQDQQFAPTVTTPYQLKEKMAQLTAFYNKNTSKPKSNMVVIS